MKKQLYQTANVAIGLFLFFVNVNTNAAETSAPTAPSWGLDPITGTLLSPGISVMTSGTLQNPGLGGGISDGDHAIKLYDTSNITPTDLRPQQNPDVHTHHHWDIGSIGNVFGLAIDKDRNIYATASTHWGAGYFNGGAAQIGFGAIGAGTSSETAVSDNDVLELNSTAAAGTIYKINAITGDATIFAQLPQQAFSFNQGVCEGSAPDIARNTGPALGNIAYDPIHNQFFVSNFEDGKIYRISSAGVTLNSFDPFATDDGTAGLASDARPYGLVVNPDGTKLYFGTHELNLAPKLFAINMDSTGNFSGSEVNQNATLGTDLIFTQSVGGGQTSNPWISYSDLKFSPKGELILGLRTGCESNFATSHNHGGTFYLLTQDAGGLYNTPASEAPGNTNNSDGIKNYDAGSLSAQHRGDSYGPDDGYGGVAIYDKGTGEYDYLVTTSDSIAEAGPHGFLLFPDDFTLTGNSSSTFLLRPAATFSAFPSSTSSSGDYKGSGGDIEVLSVEMDWGDAPDTYSTDLYIGNAAGGADVRGPSHIIADGVFLGTSVDDESNGVPNINANGDDTSDAPDDEDGISAFPALHVNDTSYTIPIANITAANSSGSPVTIHAWIDFDGSGAFDVDEYTSTTVANGATSPSSDLVWQEEVSGMTTETTSVYSRFRITNDTDLSASTPGGYADNGEVEDYLITITSQDWGDAPDASYPTLLVNDGPRHTLDSALFMGTCVDDEANGQQSTTANGDDNGVASNNTNGTCATANDDEDSLTPPTLTDSQSSPTVDVTVVNTTGSDSTVACWVDYNGNNTFDNATERGSAIINASGTATVTLPNVPATANDDTGGSTFMRCRIASNATEVTNATGVAANGEVEDYPISINAIPVVAPTPSIDIEKATNTVDADTATEAVVLDVDDAVTWSFVVTNNGNETLNSISANDDKEGAITCPKTTLVAAEPMTCTAKTGAAVVGNYANIASVSGIGITSTTTVNDSDPSHYKVTPTPSIDIEKATNSIDADTEGEAVVLNIGASVTWSFVITNIGNETLNSITANDDLEGAIICPKTTLLAAESMICTAITGTAGTVGYENIASVSGTGAVSSLVVTDNDPSHYRVISPIPTPQDPAKPIPTLSEWGQIILMILMGLVAYNQQVRQRKF